MPGGSPVCLRIDIIDIHKTIVLPGFMEYILCDGEEDYMQIK